MMAAQKSTFEKPMAEEMLQSILDAKPLVDGGWKISLSEAQHEIILSKSDGLYRLRLPSGKHGYEWHLSPHWAGIEETLRSLVWWGGGLYSPK